jgi:hypothetical protein
VPVSGRTKRRPGEILARTAITAAVASAALFGLSACSTNPHAPELTAPSAEPAAQDSSHTHGKRQGIALPSTISLSFGLAYGKPNLLDPGRHTVLWAVNQALKAQLNSSYEKTSAATPDLQRLWTGSAYTAVYDDSTAWIVARQVPVGQVIVTGTTVQSLAADKSTVTYCQDMSRVDRGRAKTNQLGPALQPANSDGTWVTLTLTPSGQRSAWQVAQMVKVGSSTLCPPPSGRHQPSMR